MRLSRWLMIAIVTAVTALSGVHSGAGGRLAPVAPKCPSDLPKKHIDWKGAEDACVYTQPPRCEANETLATDQKTFQDACIPTVVGPAAKAHNPSCPTPTKWVVKAGPDICEHAKRPPCPGGMRYKTRPGEDSCVG